MIKKIVTTFIIVLTFSTQMSFPKYEVLSFGFMTAAAQNADARKVTQEDADKLMGDKCTDENVGKIAGQECTSNVFSQKAVHDGKGNTITTEHWVSMALVWVSAFILIGQIGCMMCGQCGWTTAIGALGALALLIGEIIATVKHRATVDNIEYRKNKLSEFKDKCIDGTITEEEDINAGIKVNGEVISVCDQYSSLYAQREAYESIKKGLEIKKGLFIAAGAIYGAGALIEFGMFLAGETKKEVTLANVCQGMPALAAAGNPVGAEAAACAICTSALGINCSDRRLEDIEDDQNFTNSTGLIRGEGTSAGLTGDYHRGEAGRRQSTMARKAKARTTLLDTSCRSCTRVTTLLNEVVSSDTMEQQIRWGRPIATHPDGCPAININIVADADNQCPSPELQKQKYLQKREVLAKSSVQEQVEIINKNLKFEKPYFVYDDSVWDYFHHSGPMAGFVRDFEEEMVFFEKEWGPKTFLSYEATTNFDSFVERTQDFSYSEFYMAEKITSKMNTDNQDFKLINFFISSAVAASSETETSQSNNSEVVESKAGHDKRFKAGEANSESASNLASKIVGFLGIGAAIIIGLTKVASPIFSWFYESPPLRAFIYLLVGGGILAHALLLIENTIKDMKTRINAINAILSQAGVNATAAQVSMKPMSAKDLTRAFGTQEDIQIFEEGEQGFFCPCGGTGQGGDASTACRQTCPETMSVPFQSVDIPDVNALEDTMNKLATNLAGSDSVTGADFSNFGRIIGSNNAIQSRLKKAKIKAFDKLKGLDDGKGPKDMDALTDRAAAKLRSNLSNFLASKGLSAQELLGGGATLGEDDGKEAKEDDSLAEKTGKDAPAVVVADSKTNPFANFQLRKRRGLNFDDDSESSGFGSAGYDKKLDSLQVPDNDIYKNTEDNIFKIITVRYMKTAYPVFFEEDGEIKKK